MARPNGTSRRQAPGDSTQPRHEIGEHGQLQRAGGSGSIDAEGRTAQALSLKTKREVATRECEWGRETDGACALETLFSGSSAFGRCVMLPLRL